MRNTNAEEPAGSALINTLQCFPSGEQYPFALSASEGSYLHLADGRRLLDCDCGDGVFSLGHRNTAVKAALEEALGRYDMGNHHLISEPKGNLAKRLSELLPRGLARTVFNVTRSEAVDAAIKLARGATGRPGVVSTDHAFHGSDGFALAASDPQFANKLHLNIPGFFHVPFGDPESLGRTLDQHRGEIAAVILEPVAVEAGARIPDPEYLLKARALCDKSGSLLIVDESATGLGRSGELFAVNRSGVSPDILIAGNALGGGLYPVHATCHRESLDHFYVKNPFIHISTFGGGELGCFAAMAALEQLAGRSLLRNVGARAREIAASLETLRAEYPETIVAVRSLGLLFGIEFISDDEAGKALSLLFRNGVFCRCAALDARTLLLRPPLNLQEREAQELVEALESAFRGLSRGDGGDGRC